MAAVAVGEFAEQAVGAKSCRRCDMKTKDFVSCGLTARRADTAKLTAMAA
jgi:hypothetical protein